MSNKKKEIFIIVDGSSYLYRAFYALPHLQNKSGSHTGAIHGVANMINKILNDYTPKYFCVVFDARGKNFRHKLYPEYKSNRKSMPRELADQVQPIIQYVKSLGLNMIQEPGVEADDVIASLVRLHSGKIKTLISSGDKDLAQLVDSNVTLLNSFDGIELNPSGVKRKFGVEPVQIKDYLTLIGDTSDNIPGVPKIGPKTAVSLLDKYKDLPNIIKNVDELKGKMAINIKSSFSSMELAQELITLKEDIHVDNNIESFAISPLDSSSLGNIIEEYDLKKISKDLDIDRPLTTSKRDKKYFTITKCKELDALIKKINKNKIFSFDTETTSLDPMVAEIIGVSFCLSSNEAYYIPLTHSELDTEIKENYLMDNLKTLFKLKNLTLIGQNIKYDMNVLKKYNVTIDCKIEDTMIMSYIYNSSGKHDMDSLSEKYLNYKTTKYEDIAGSGAKQKLLSELSAEKVFFYACEDADITFQLYKYFNNEINKSKELDNLYRKIELPLVKILSSMEFMGVKIDKSKLKKLSDSLSDKIVKLQKKIYKLAEQEFNISSPKQLQEIFYDKLKLPILKKTPKGQPSTSEDVMLDLSEHHELPKLVLDYRNLSKLKNTYTDKLGDIVNEDSRRLHTSYNQTVTITGRLSSSNPNLQNIPIRTDNGREIRKAFIAEPGNKILSADYSQIELRVMAHLSQDPALLESFSKGEDIHSATAREVFNHNEKTVSDDERRVAKTINFGLIYGISSFGLAKQLRIDTKSAKDFIDKYFSRYSGVRDFMDEIKNQAKKDGYVSTLSGRKVFLPNITHSNFQIRSAAERTAINAPIQGTAADILKVAMININDWIEKEKGKVSMLMQVHDELVFEVDKSLVESATKTIDKLMSSSLKLDVPLIVDIGIGENWDKAH